MNRRTAILAAALTVSVALLVLALLWNPGTRRPEGPTTGRKVVLVGVDGLDWVLMRRLLERGELPSLNGIVRRSLTGEVAPDRPPVPDVGWTVMGRGRALTEDEQALASGADGRLFGRVPELARLVNESGGRALCVGWPASWPVGGAAALTAAPYRRETPVHETGLPAAILDASPLSSSPDVSDMVERALKRDEDVCEQEFRRLIFDGDAEDGIWRDHLLALRWSFLADLTTLDIAASVMADEEPDLTMVCLGGADAAVHRFLAPSAPEFYAEMPGEYARYAEVLKNYYAFIDAGIERLRRLTTEDTIFIVCSPYGTYPSLDVPNVFASHREGPPGVFLAMSMDIAPRPQAIALTAADIAPTVLAMLGLDIPTDMDGRVIRAAVPEGLLGEHPLSYAGSSQTLPVEPSAEDLAAMERLAGERLSSLERAMDKKK